jgi:DNA-binding transcriptional LysR family regulator
MQIEALKIFSDLVKTSSFSETAKLNFISQSAVSQQIKKIEETLNVVLIRNRGKNFLLSEEGKIFYLECEKILGHYDNIIQKLSKNKTSATKFVRIATIYSIGFYNLLDYLKDFLKKFPGIHVDIDYKRFPDIYDDVINSKVDFGLVAYPKRKTSINIIPFEIEQLELICSKDHRLRTLDNISLAELNNEKFIAFEKDQPTRKVIDNFLKKSNVKLHIEMECDNIETMKRAVEINAGIAIMPIRTIEEELKKKSLFIVSCQRLKFERPLGIITRKKIQLSIAAQNFIEVLTSKNKPVI